MNLRTKKCFTSFTYNPIKSPIRTSPNSNSDTTEAFFCKTYEHLLIMSYFNANISEPTLTYFCTLFKFKNLVKKPTCYKNPDNPSCIAVFLTNCVWSFQNTCIFETGLSDFHKLVVTLLRSKFKSLPPKIISCGIYKEYNKEKFKDLFLRYVHEK